MKRFGSFKRTVALLANAFCRTRVRMQAGMHLKYKYTNTNTQIQISAHQHVWECKQRCTGRQQWGRDAPLRGDINWDKKSKTSECLQIEECNSYQKFGIASKLRHGIFFTPIFLSEITPLIGETTFTLGPISKILFLCSLLMAFFLAGFGPRYFQICPNSCRYDKGTSDQVKNMFWGS